MLYNSHICCVTVIEKSGRIQTSGQISRPGSSLFSKPIFRRWLYFPPPSPFPQRSMQRTGFRIFKIIRCTGSNFSSYPGWYYVVMAVKLPPLPPLGENISSKQHCKFLFQAHTLLVTHTVRITLVPRSSEPVHHWLMRVGGGLRERLMPCCQAPTRFVGGKKEKIRPPPAEKMKIVFHINALMPRSLLKKIILLILVSFGASLMNSSLSRTLGKGWSQSVFLWY